MIYLQFKKQLIFTCIVLAIVSCKRNAKENQFSYVSSSRSNITFKNTIKENDSLNVISFQYVYNGGGVGIGDFNNDGFSDVVLTGNQVASKLYLNQQELNFKDISEASNFKIKPNKWITGVSIVDINADGWDDIYLNVGGANCKNNCENLLFINQGLNERNLPVFKEQAKEYNLNEGNYSQQAIFFDFDMDGDLDVFIGRNGNLKFDKNSPLPKHYLPENLSDVLLINEIKEGIDHPVFTDVSKAMGITHKGFTLGVAIQDFNNDNLPDIYVSNDFITEDLLYINKGVDTTTNKHLGFVDKNQSVFKHLTYNAMGVDVADINNDEYPDVLVVDMLPEKYERQKKMLGAMNYEKYLLAKRNKYASQFMHNTLQLHNGILNDTILKASETGHISGMSSTDWSWAPIFADFDNDGYKDVYITNGYVKDITDLDFINYSSQSTIFGNQKAKDSKLKKLLKELPGIHLSNYFYKNNNQLEFSNVSDVWITERESFSNGVAYADLDNDGDLDLVVNNINEEAFLIQNNVDKLKDKQYLRVRLKGDKQNRKGIGSKVMLWQAGKVQHQYQSVIRGYLSSMEPIIHFGLPISKIDSLQVIWPNGKVSKIKEINSNTSIDIDIKFAQEEVDKREKKETLLRDISETFTYEHIENKGHDYREQHLLMRQYSKFGPCIARANIDEKKGDEIFIGGSKGAPSSIWAENSEGVFSLKQELDKDYEDTAAVFVDIDNDNDLDLFVSSGGTEYPQNSDNLKNRVYLNTGKGNFKKQENILPLTTNVSSCIQPNDFDKDGDIDFFVGSRIVAGNYPEAPKSELLINTNGIFTNEIPEALEKIGMVTDAAWKDINSDGWDDLIVVGEWMPITIFINEKGKLKKTTVNFNNNSNEKVTTSGWWNAIEVADFDNDGDYDFIVGNQGENGYMIPRKDKPIYLYNKDFDKNGSMDPVLGQYYTSASNKEVLLPVQTRDDILKQLVKLKKSYPTYEAFSKVNFMELLDIKNLEKETLKAVTFSSSYIENLGDGNYKITPLPKRCQIAPINDMLVKDIDKDGYLDVLLVGNDNTSETNYGLNDAHLGVYLKGTKKGFEVLKNNQTGFYVPGQSHHLISVKTKNEEDLIFASQNNKKAKLFLINNKKK